MKIQRGPPPFAISTEAAFNENGVWMIEAHLRFHRRAVRQVTGTLLGEARLALMDALTHEALRGRALGASVLRVRLDTGGHVTELSFDDRIPDVDLLH